MGRLLSRLLGRPPASVTPAGPSPWESVTSGLAELLDLAAKASRAQGRVGLRLEEVERKVEAGFDDLRRQVAGMQAAAATALDWADALDALDALSEAQTLALSTGREDLAGGMASIAARLERFLAQGAVQRIAGPGPQLDGKLFRVVGTQHRPDLAGGTVVRVVRAAALVRGIVVREGEVIVNGPPE